MSNISKSISLFPRYINSCNHALREEGITTREDGQYLIAAHNLSLSQCFYGDPKLMYVPRNETVVYGKLISLEATIDARLREISKIQYIRYKDKLLDSSKSSETPFPTIVLNGRSYRRLSKYTDTEDINSSTQAKYLQIFFIDGKDHANRPGELRAIFLFPHNAKVIQTVESGKEGIIDLLNEGFNDDNHSFKYTSKSTARTDEKRLMEYVQKQIIDRDMFIGKYNVEPERNPEPYKLTEEDIGTIANRLGKDFAEIKKAVESGNVNGSLMKEIYHIETEAQLKF